MDGYSVQEAASVLGVAEGRVWELLARGVLLGTPEGDSMRVFLKAQPGPISTADEPPRTNGNGGANGGTGEASAFRELLTEFRNLTERYGQALLALGEARGEVAGLRSRVDQLEARLDLRLPPPLEAAPVAWESATIPAAAPESAPEPTFVVPPPAPTAPTRPARPKPRPRKARTPREAVAGFADALARAQDPSAAELGESRAAPQAVAAASPAADLELETVAAADEPLAEAVPEEQVAEPEPELEAVAAADETPVVAPPEDEQGVEPEPAVQAAAALDMDATVDVATADVEAADIGDAGTEDGGIEDVSAEEAGPEAEQPSYSAVVVEPDWFADGDFAWLDAAEMEASGPAEAPSVAVEPVEPEQEAVSAPAELAQDAPAEQIVELEPEPEPEPFAVEERGPGQPVSAPEPLEAPAFEAAAATDVPFEAWQSPELTPEPPTASSAVAVEEEVMWLGAEPSAPPADEPPVDQRSQVDAWPAVDSPARSTDAVRPPLAMTEDELARLALDEGWDEAEVAAIRAMITPVSSSPVDLPGAAELHEAMAALEAVPVRGDPSSDPSRQWAKPAPGDEQPPRQDDWAFDAEPAQPAAPATRPASDVTAALRRSVADPGWLRRRQGPAAAAYRRLRRLFPG